MFIIKLISSYTKAKGKKWTMISITKDKELMIEAVVFKIISNSLRSITD